jgi:hypothetical protein
VLDLGGVFDIVSPEVKAMNEALGESIAGLERMPQ